jgi:hypothetical protein
VATWAKFGFKVTQRLCERGEGLCPLGPNLGFFRDCFSFAGFSSFNFPSLALII